jgi:hypothetical protein
LKSKQAQLADKHAEAVHSALQAFRLGEMVVAGSRDNRDEWIIGIQIERLALRRLEELAADAKTSDAALMEILVCLNQSNSQGVVDSYKTGLRVEYTRFREPYIRNFIDGEYQDPGEPNWGLKTRAIPYFFKSNMTNRLIVASYRHQMARFDSPVYRIRNDDSDKLGLPNSALSRLEYLLKPNSQGKLFAYNLTYVFEKDLLRKIRHQAYLSALRLKIAIRLYENEYGKLPNDLISLQPKFLKDIPRDPYIGQPFRYSKSAKTVWAVGSDLNDNDGKMKENERMCDYQNYDLVMPLVTRELIPNTKGFKPILPGPAQ